MTSKRYFKRMWEEEYYIFDSETISENEFDEKVEYEDYQAFEDSMLGDEVVERLNTLNDENEQLKERNKKRLQRLKNQRKGLEKQQEAIWGYKGDIKQLKKENEQLQARNDRQAKRLAELYELISKKDWESLTEIIDDFCSCEEQLQREWRIYE